MGEKKERAPKRSPDAMAEARALELRQIAEDADRKVSQAHQRLQDALVRAEAAAEVSQKREDDRVKVLLGAAVGHALASGRSVTWTNASDALIELDRFLVRPAERLAVLGENGKGSNAFWRILNPKANKS